MPYEKVDFAGFPCVKVHKQIRKSKIFFCITSKNIYRTVKKLTFSVDFNEGAAVQTALIPALA